MDLLPALKTITEYPADQSFVQGGVKVYTSEYEDAFLELLVNASMGDTMDVETLCADADAAFAAIG